MMVENMLYNFQECKNTDNYVTQFQIGSGGRSELKCWCNNCLRSFKTKASEQVGFRSMLLWFRKRFSRFSTTSTKNIEKTKKNKTARPNGHIGLNFFFWEGGVVSWFFRSFCYFGQKTFKTPWENQKQKQKNTTARPNGYRAELFVFIVGFLEVLLLWVGSQKNNLEKTKNKKTQNCQTQWAHRAKLFWLFVFSTFVLLWAENKQKPWANQQKQKTKLPNPIIT